MCEVVCSRSVLRRFSTCFGAGDIVGDELPCLDGRTVVVSCTTCMSCSDGDVLQDSNSDLTTLVGIGWTHCTDVPCQLLFVWALDTIA